MKATYHIDSKALLHSTKYYYLSMAEDIIFRLLWVLGLVLKKVMTPPIMTI